VLRLSHLTLARGARRLLVDADLTVHDRHKVGIVGANGSGKSSLFAAIRGELLPDAGEIDVPAAWMLAHVAQETAPTAMPAIEYVLDGDAELRAIERALDQPQLYDGAQLAELHHRLDAIGGYDARARAATLLAGLGIDEARQAQPVAHFSGGWRMRINLAQALMCRSDLLLLDEPTNHLDLETKEMLVKALSSFEGTMLFVSHDRQFLRALSNRVLEIGADGVRAYGGGYAEYVVESGHEAPGVG